MHSTLHDGGRRTRVQHVLGSLASGGAEIRTLELIERANSEVFQFEVCLLASQVGELEDRASAVGARVSRCRWGWGFVLRYWLHLHRTHPDVVESHVHLASGTVLSIAWLARVPNRIAHFHVTDDSQGNSMLRRLWRRVNRWLVTATATAVVVVSDATLSAVWPDRLDDPRFQVIHNGIDLTRFTGARDRDEVRRTLGVQSGDLLLLHVGNQHAAKNHQRVLSIFEELHRRRDAKLVLVGRPEERIAKELAQSALAAGIQDAILVLGTRSDVPDLMNASDVFIFPSRWEGLPGVVQEAVASGLPVVGSDIPPIVEVSSYLPGISLMSLRQADSDWVDAVENAAEARIRLGPPGGPSALQSVGWDVDSVANEYEELWLSHVRRCRA